MQAKPITLSGYRAILGGNVGVLTLGTAQSRGNEQLQITCGAGWEGLTVKLVFHPSEVEVAVPESGLVDVPWEATAQELTNGTIVFNGVGDGRVVNTTDINYRVLGTSATEGKDTTDATPSVWEQFTYDVSEYRAEAVAAAEQAQTAATDAKTAKATAETAASKAAESAGSAGTAATNAATSESNAKSSAPAAEKSATAAADSKTKAAESAAAAAKSVKYAQESESNAASSATDAAASATDAADRATNAEKYASQAEKYAQSISYTFGPDADGKFSLFLITEDN